METGFVRRRIKKGMSKHVAFVRRPGEICKTSTTFTSHKQRCSNLDALDKTVHKRHFYDSLTTVFLMPP